MSDPIEPLLGELHREVGTIDVENRWRVILNRFAVDIVNAVLPDDPFAQRAVLRKAEEIGIDIGTQTGSNVVQLVDHIRSKTHEMTVDQRAALQEIREHIDDLIVEARAAKLGSLAASLEGVRGSITSTS